jgi:Cu(I)/Ag(I) efflux system membrane fusion protein
MSSSKTSRWCGSASARATVAAYAGQVFAGTVAFIYPSVTRETRTAPVQVELPSPGERL